MGLDRKRTEYIEPGTRRRLLKNSLPSPLEHAVLSFWFALPVRQVELARLMTCDFVNQQGVVERNEDFYVRPEISFSGSERPMPIVDAKLIKRFQRYVDSRIENKNGVTKTGYIDLDTPFFINDSGESFRTGTTKLKSGDERVFNYKINRFIQDILERNNVHVSLDSALRTWTIDVRKKGTCIKEIFKLRGGRDIKTVKRVLENDPLKYSRIVDNVL